MADANKRVLRHGPACESRTKGGLGEREEERGLRCEGVRYSPLICRRMYAGWYEGRLSLHCRRTPPLGRIGACRARHGFISRRERGTVERIRVFSHQTFSSFYGSTTRLSGERDCPPRMPRTAADSLAQPPPRVMAPICCVATAAAPPWLSMALSHLLPSQLDRLVAP